MNPLSSTTTLPLSSSSPGAAVFFPQGSVATLLGQVRDWRLAWAGRIHFTLRTSAGDLTLVANRDTLRLDIGDGTWVRAKLMHRHSSEGPATQLLSAIATVPSPGDTSWVPTALYHRSTAIRALRRLVGALEPALQGLFISVMLDSQVQRGFFWRPDASDHHCYPGGLLDRSVLAARFAHDAVHESERKRGLATIASLLFDIGKVFDATLRPDAARDISELHAHSLTAKALQRPLDSLALLDARTTADLSELLDLVTPSSRMPTMRGHVRQAVRKSWSAGAVTPALKSSTGEGA